MKDNMINMKDEDRRSGILRLFRLETGRRAAQLLCHRAHRTVRPRAGLRRAF